MSNENTSTESLHSRQWFHEEEKAKSIQISMFLVWLEMTLDIDLSVGGWFYL